MIHAVRPKEAVCHALVIGCLICFGIFSLKAQKIQLQPKSAPKMEGVWTGHMYVGKDRFSGKTYPGLVEFDIFDRKFGQAAAYTAPLKGKQYFSTRYEMEKTFTPGYYKIVVGSDAHIRLKSERDKQFIIDVVAKDNVYNIFEKVLFLDGFHHFTLECSGVTLVNRISFDYTFLGNDLNTTALNKN